jgi:hypothetical protein
LERCAISQRKRFGHWSKTIAQCCLYHLWCLPVTKVLQLNNVRGFLNTIAQDALQVVHMPSSCSSTFAFWRWNKRYHWSHARTHQVSLNRSWVYVR